MEVSCTYCFNGTENECKDCGGPICADHSNEDNECLDAEGSKVHVPVAAAPKPKAAPRPKRTAASSD